MITNDGLSNYKPPPLLQELDLTDCWLLSKEALLDFCKAYPQIMVWNEKTVGITSAAKSNTLKKEYGDVVNGGIATSFSREQQQALLNQHSKSPAKFLSKDRMKVTKKPSNSKSAAMHIHVLGMCYLHVCKRRGQGFTVCKWKSRADKVMRSCCYR